MVSLASPKLNATDELASYFYSDLTCLLVTTWKSERHYKLLALHTKIRLFSPCWGLLFPMLAVLSVLDGLYLILTTRQRRPSLFFLQHGFENPCWTKGDRKMAAAGGTLEDIHKRDWARVFLPANKIFWTVCLTFAFLLRSTGQKRSSRAGFFSQTWDKGHFQMLNCFFSNVGKWLTELEVIVRDVVYIWLALTTWAKQIFFWNQLKCQLEFVMFYFTESRRFKRLIQRCSLVSWPVAGFLS